MSDHSANDPFGASADDVSKQDEIDKERDALRDQDLDRASGGYGWHLKGDRPWYVEDEAGGDAAADATTKNDNPESDR